MPSTTKGFSVRAFSLEAPGDLPSVPLLDRETLVDCDYAARGTVSDHALISGSGTGEEIRAAGGVDAVINFAPTPATWPAMLAAIRPLGRIVAAALVAVPVPVSQDWLTATGVEITGTSVGTRLELQELLRMHAREPFVSELTRVRLVEANAALDALEAGRVNGRQVIDFSHS